jgi:hypothetical protein
MKIILLIKLYMSYYLNTIINRDLMSDTGASHFYYDVTVFNNSIDGSPVDLQFTESRTAPFLSDPSQFYVSIIRFHLDTVPSSLPLFIPQIQIGQSDVNKTVYSFTLKYKTFEKQTFVSFTPQNQFAVTPAAPTVKQDLSSEYYFMYSFSAVVDMFNAALLSCFNDLQTLVVAGSDTLPTEYCPWIQYDPSTSSMIINCDKLGYDSTLTNPIQVFFNAPTANLFASFQMVNLGFTGVTNGKNYKLVVHNDFETNVLELPDYNAIQIYEEYPAVSGWSPIKSVMFTSSSLPVEGTIVGVPKQYGIVNEGASSTSSNMSLPIITDFSISSTNGKDYYPSIDYVASGNYRMIDMFGHNSQSQLQLSVYWSDHYNNIYPLKLASQTSCNIKIMFRKKDLGI